VCERYFNGFSLDGELKADGVADAATDDGRAS
jgi:hypothetical protein